MREDPTLTLAAFGAALALLAYALLMVSGYATVARRWLSEAWERQQEDHRMWLQGQVRNDKRRAAASFPGGSYVEEGGR